MLKVVKCHIIIQAIISPLINPSNKSWFITIQIKWTAIQPCVKKMAFLNGKSKKRFDVNDVIYSKASHTYLP